MNILTKHRRQRRQTEKNFLFILNTKSRICHFLREKITSYSIVDIIGLDIDTDRKWTEYQLTPEMNWTNIEMGHKRPICLFAISNSNEL